MPLLDEAANILRLLLNETELREGPIAFICHSLGGLIVERILRAANERRSDPAAADLVSRTREVVFIATPHTGSGKATLMETLGFLVWGSIRRAIWSPTSPSCATSILDTGNSSRRAATRSAILVSTRWSTRRFDGS